MSNKVEAEDMKPRGHDLPMLLVVVDLTDPADVRVAISLNHTIISGKDGDPHARESAARYRAFALQECARLAEVARRERTTNVLQRFGVKE